MISEDNYCIALPGKEGKDQGKILDSRRIVGERVQTCALLPGKEGKDSPRNQAPGFEKASEVNKGWYHVSTHVKIILLIRTAINQQQVLQIQEDDNGKQHR